ncbi:MAG: class III poly(R)-hydroxyalkanoic acid synthase subunit PhaC [Cycloclasticus sp.]
MPSSKQKNEDVWQDDFVLLMDQFSAVNRQSLPDVGSTPKEVIYQENKLRLIRYLPLNVEQKKTPVLIVYALVNRPYIVDLEPGRSLVLRLLENGYPVYLIDWGYPDSSDCFTSLNDYINGLLYRCVQRVKRFTQSKQIDLLGICQGGVFSLCYTALHPADVRKIITLVTPVDFHSKGNSLSLWTNSIDGKVLSNNTGNIPGGTISLLFRTLKPFQLNRDKYRQISQLVQNKKNLATFLRMEQWLNDNPDLARLAALQFMENFYQKNRLHNKELTIDGEDVLLESINCPVLNLYAEQDHIVPPDCASALSQHIKAEYYEEHALKGGHIGAFTSLKTQQKLINALTNWLN